jgi:hypothetical protein
MESVINAKGNGLPPQSEREHILDRLQRLAVENPHLVEYQLTTEHEAQELLTAMAAMLKVMIKDVNHPTDKRELKNYANEYRHAVIQGNALTYLHKLNPDDELELFGLKITTSVIIQ